MRGDDIAEWQDRSDVVDEVLFSSIRLMAETAASRSGAVKS